MIPGITLISWPSSHRKGIFHWKLSSRGWSRVPDSSYCRPIIHCRAKHISSWGGTTWVGSSCEGYPGVPEQSPPYHSEDAGEGGVKDVCALYRRSKVDTILQSLGPKDVLCVICKKEFSNKQHLRTHLKSKHFGRTAYFCEECRKYFTDSTSLAAHMRAHDPELKKFKCPKCDERFITQPKLAEHMPTHGGRVYMCHFCRQKSFKHLKGVREHESTCQANPKAEGPFICRICGKSYKEKRGRGTWRRSMMMLL